MEQSRLQAVLRVLAQAQDMTLATIRPDGYPQATTVSYAHDGLTLYAAIALHGQKAHNITLNNKVSLTVTLPYADWRAIAGLSMGGVAELLSDAELIAVARRHLERRFADVDAWGGPNMSRAVGYLRITPQVISLLDYSQGFGHAELLDV